VHLVGFIVRILASSQSYISVMSVRRSVRMEQISSHWTDFYEILYLNTFR